MICWLCLFKAVAAIPRILKQQVMTVMTINHSKEAFISQTSSCLTCPSLPPTVFSTPYHPSPHPTILNHHFTTLYPKIHQHQPTLTTTNHQPPTNPWASPHPPAPPLHLPGSLRVSGDLLGEELLSLAPTEPGRRLTLLHRDHAVAPRRALKAG